MLGILSWNRESREHARKRSPRELANYANGRFVIPVGEHGRRLQYEICVKLIG